MKKKKEEEEEEEEEKEKEEKIEEDRRRRRNEGVQREVAGTVIKHIERTQSLITPRHVTLLICYYVSQFSFRHSTRHIAGYLVNQLLQLSVDVFVRVCMYVRASCVFSDKLAASTQKN